MEARFLRPKAMPKTKNLFQFFAIIQKNPQKSLGEKEQGLWEKKTCFKICNNFYSFPVIKKLKTIKWLP
jgi:hypothetical protein